VSAVTGADLLARQIEVATALSGAWPVRDLAGPWPDRLAMLWTRSATRAAGELGPDLVGRH